MKNALNFAEKIAYSSRETLNFTYECALKMQNAEGDFVECGVAAGAQIIALAAGANGKKIHCFDSFEGIPMPSNRDNQMPGIRNLTPDEIEGLPEPGKQTLRSSGATVVSLEDFKQNIAHAFTGLPAPNLCIYKGWFEDTVPKNRIEKIAILRLDGDLYNSTLVCLQHLFKKVIKGGIVIIDDWQLPGCRAACDDYFNSIGYQPRYQFISNISFFVNE